MRDRQIVQPRIEAAKDPMISALTRDFMDRLRLWASQRHPELDPDTQLRDLAHGGQLVLSREDHSGQVRGQLAELVKVEAVMNGEPLVSFAILWHASRVVSIEWHGLGRYQWVEERGRGKEKGDGEPSPAEAWKLAQLGEGALN